MTQRPVYRHKLKKHVQMQQCKCTWLATQKQEPKSSLVLPLLKQAKLPQLSISKFPRPTTTWVDHRRMFSIRTRSSCATSICSGRIPPCCNKRSISRIRSATKSLPNTAPPRRTVSWNQYSIRYNRSFAMYFRFEPWKGASSV